MNKTYCCSDLHGCFNLYKKIKNYIDDTDTVICLGDCADRGPSGWDIITDMYNDPRFIYLRGNHEDMLIDAIREWLPFHLKGENYYLLEWNGGSKTFRDWKNSPERNKWYRKLKTLPYHYVYTNEKGQVIYLTHSGFIPKNKKLNIDDKKDILWDREHMKEKT